MSPTLYKISDPAHFTQSLPIFAIGFGVPVGLQVGRQADLAVLLEVTAEGILSHQIVVSAPFPIERYNIVDFFIRKHTRVPDLKP